jgi:hypothetical protein
VIRESVRSGRVRAPEPATPHGAVIDCTAPEIASANTTPESVSG